jgi:MoaA/NifB/PqqE/SkfB family radical SAM enzyme
MAAGRRIGWASTDRYSPIQDRVGILDPIPEDIPPVTQRVSQHPDPYSPAFLDEREILRVTYQGDDRCQLRCPGCYTGERLQRPSLAPAVAGARLRTPFEEFSGQVAGLGDGLQDFYLLGAEPTMDPEGSDERLAWAADRGLSVMSITNGAVAPARFDRTFGRSLDAGELYKLIVSLDSIVPEINNELRGSPFAHERTLATIRRCVQRGAPVKVQITVWPRNYATIMDTVHALWEIGVRGFAFHGGSVEGSNTLLASGLEHVDPLAWRALCEQLYAFREAYRDELVHFNFPLLYFTEAELRASVIGEDELTDAYLDHVAALEKGHDSTKPFHACPGLDAPQVYVFGNGGEHGHGSVSICNVHSPDADAAFAEYEPESKRWQVVADPARNQMQRMVDSPHLCPAMPGATGRSSDRVATEYGDLYHACRYLGCNQVPIDPHQFGPQAYADAVEYYRAMTVARSAFVSREGPEPYLARARRVTAGLLSLHERAVALLRDAVDVAGLTLEGMAALDVPAPMVDAVRAAEGRPRSVLPLPFPIWSVTSGGPGVSSVDGPVRACGGSCR